VHAGLPGMPDCTLCSIKKHPLHNYSDHFSLKCWPILIILSLLHSQMNCGKTVIKSTTSPQMCCCTLCTTLWKLNVWLCNFTARYLMRVWCKIVNLQNLSTRYVKLCFICLRRVFKILEHVLKIVCPQHARVCQVHASDALLTLQWKTFSRRCCKILQYNVKWC